MMAMEIKIIKAKRKLELAPKKTIFQAEIVKKERKRQIKTKIAARRYQYLPLFGFLYSGTYH